MSDIAYIQDHASTPVKRSRAKPAPQPEQLSREALDLRLTTNKRFNKIVSNIVADLGGEKCLSETLRGLIEAFAGARSSLDDLNARRLLGQPINPVEYSTLASTMVSLSERIDIERHKPEEART
jgi:hypothetical protein